MEKKPKSKSKNKDDSLKYEIADELGLIERVRSYGWKSLSAKETGKIGGLIAKRKKALEIKEGQQA